MSITLQMTPSWVLFGLYLSVGAAAATILAYRDKLHEKQEPFEWDEYFIASRRDHILSALFAWDVAGMGPRPSLALRAITVAALWPVGAIYQMSWFLFICMNQIHPKVNQWRLRRRKGRFLARIVQVQPELDRDEREALWEHISELQAKKDEFDFARYPITELARFFDENSVVAESSQADQSVQPSSDALDESPRFSRSEPRAPHDSWGFYMSSCFSKSIASLDKNTRRRALKAISELCVNPLGVRGDTIKPLTGELVGFWRYRIGDYRLIYRTDRALRRIDLISIAQRNSSYRNLAR